MTPGLLLLSLPRVILTLRGDVHDQDCLFIFQLPEVKILSIRILDGEVVEARTVLEWAGFERLSTE